MNFTSMAGRFRHLHLGFLALTLAGSLSGARVFAHTLPISYVFIVSDKDYVHLELSFNPFELASFSEFDTNRNGRLDPAELDSAQEKLPQQILAHLKLSADGKPVVAETAGLSPDGDSHHATLRAHYPVNASRAVLSLESSLQDITSSSHLTQVNFLRDGKPQLAQLDSQSHKVAFKAPAGGLPDPALPTCCPTCAPADGKGTIIALGAAFAVVIFVALRQKNRGTPATKSENPSHSNPPSTS